MSEIGIYIRRYPNASNLRCYSFGFSDETGQLVMDGGQQVQFALDTNLPFVDGQFNHILFYHFVD